MWMVAAKSIGLVAGYWLLVDGVCSEEESETMKTLVFAKEKELALALMKVAELTSQLDQLRCTGGTPTSHSTDRTTPAGLSTNCSHDFACGSQMGFAI